MSIASAPDVRRSRSSRAAATVAGAKRLRQLPKRRVRAGESGTLALDERFHLAEAANSRHLDQIVPVVERIRPAIDEEPGDRHLVLAYGEIQRRAVLEMCSDERRTPVDQPFDGFEIAGRAGAEQLPDFGAVTRRPDQWFIPFQFIGLDHADASGRP
jgi:hypothetical protein